MLWAEKQFILLVYLENIVAPEINVEGRGNFASARAFVNCSFLAGAAFHAGGVATDLSPHARAGHRE
jgi:hypothetical protein